jgi:hypothetical protein
MKMSKLNIKHLVVGMILLTLLTGCTLPGFSTPTPFSFPTPDKTMTALFEPTQAVPATSASSDSDSDSDSSSDSDQVKTATPKVVATDTPDIAKTEAAQLTETAQVTETPDSTESSFEGPDVRSGPSITADYLDKNINIDGDLYEWDAPIQKVINSVVYGSANWNNADDCSGTVVAAWDEDYLYIGVRVKDDKYVQEGKKEKMYLGDSIEILFDRYVSADYSLQTMSADDY